ncbi:MAG: arginine biosynthesis protein ArgJ [Clostridiales bacterium]|nr:MAG: arginine biosynthesis protein ArgJ [Clostridiales bacterium]
MKEIQGGVCAPAGFTAAGVHCGIRKNKTKKDLALLYSEVPCAAAAVYTKNLVKGAPITVTRENLADGRAQAVLCNSGNANTCNADGPAVARRMCELAADACGINARDVIVASTGVIGQRLDVSPIEASVGALKDALSPDGSRAAAEAIMTTDTAVKEFAVSFTAGGRECRLGGIAKGSGMIHPNMATMLVFLTTDCAIAPELLQKALSADADDSFNMISVDGDTSTNDMVCILANGRAGNPSINAEGADYDAFAEALAFVTRRLCRAIAKDGEGATKLLECRVRGARSLSDARILAKSVVCSSLVKAAMFGADANWGRVLCAIGYAGVETDPNGVDVSFSSAAGAVRVCESGAGVDFSEEAAKAVLSADEIRIDVALRDGGAEATAWGCDLTYDYVRINGDYRT